MSEMSTEPMGPIPHDGWKSRTFWTGVGVIGLSFLLCTAAVGFDKANFAQAAAFLQWEIPAVLLPMLLKMWGDKKLETQR